MNDVIAEKSALRASLRSARNAFVAALPQSVKALSFSAIPAPARGAFDNAAVIGSYLAIGSEVITDNYHKTLYNRDKNLALPYFSGRDSIMALREWRPGQPLETGPFDVMQPLADSIEVIPQLLIMPLIGFDEQGGRLGQGGGHYDRYCAHYPDIIRIGLAWSIQQCDAVPLEKHDQTLDLIITQAGVIRPASSRLTPYTATPITGA